MNIEDFVELLKKIKYPPFTTIVDEELEREVDEFLNKFKEKWYLSKLQ